MEYIFDSSQSPYGCGAPHTEYTSPALSCLLCPNTCTPRVDLNCISVIKYKIQIKHVHGYYIIKPRAGFVRQQYFIDKVTFTFWAISFILQYGAQYQSHFFYKQNHLQLIEGKLRGFCKIICILRLFRAVQGILFYTKFSGWLSVQP